MACVNYASTLSISVSIHVHVCVHVNSDLHSHPCHSHPQLFPRPARCGTNKDVRQVHTTVHVMTTTVSDSSVDGTTHLISVTNPASSKGVWTHMKEHSSTTNKIGCKLSIRSYLYIMHTHVHTCMII